MANRRTTFTQSDLTRVLKAFRDAGLPAPQIVIEPERMTVSPTNDASHASDTNPWDKQ